MSYTRDSSQDLVWDENEGEYVLDSPLPTTHPGLLYIGTQKVCPILKIERQPSISSLSITPTTSQQTINAPTGTDGYSPITVSPVTSSIDANITAGNIKNGVSILNVLGTYTGDSSLSIPLTVSSGSISKKTTSFTWSLPTNATNAVNYALYNSFYGCTGITSVDLSSLTALSGQNAFSYTFGNCTNLTSANLSSLVTISGQSACSYMFSNCKLTTITLSSLTTVSGSYSCNYMFTNNTTLTSISLPALKTVSGSNGCAAMFMGCTNLANVSIPELKEITNSSGCSAMFRSCKLTSITFTKLDTITGSSACSNMFTANTTIEDIYFPALTTSSFGSTNKNQFVDMMYQTGIGKTHRIHFPSNLASTIPTLTGYPLFGGSSGYITLAFDLPATS